MLTALGEGLIDHGVWVPGGGSKHAVLHGRMNLQYGEQGKKINQSCPASTTRSSGGCSCRTLATTLSSVQIGRISKIVNLSHAGRLDKYPLRCGIISRGFVYL